MSLLQCMYNKTTVYTESMHSPLYNSIVMHCMSALSDSCADWTDGCVHMAYTYVQCTLSGNTYDGHTLCHTEDIVSPTTYEHCHILYSM